MKMKLGKYYIETRDYKSEFWMSQAHIDMLELKIRKLQKVAKAK